MKNRELRNIGIPKTAYDEAHDAIRAMMKEHALDSESVRSRLQAMVAAPEDFAADTHLGPVAARIIEIKNARDSFVGRDDPAPYRQWGDDLEQRSIEQMEWACKLPIAVQGALMPDAHPGYGLPIGGVLATENAVIPYAVGVDIACRVKMTVLDWPVDALQSKHDALKNALVRETQFGIGAKFKNKRQHDVLDRDWNVSPVTQANKDRAWSQLGTSGTGNHFVEYGILTVDDATVGLESGDYLALLSHSGSRGTGASVCSVYSARAMELHPELPDELQHLSWLDLDTEDGQEYWAAMELMGEYASANHNCIHRHIHEALGSEVLLDIENHHNFAWKEVHDDRELVVHRKGATPAGEGVLGIIPGSMATPGFIVRGLGGDSSLNSAAHGAGRVMSRTQAIKTLNWEEAKGFLAERKVELLSAGLDEVPAVYKNIHEVMAAQSDLVEPLASFAPRMVRMAKAGERPED